MTIRKIHVEGMACNHCKMTIENKLLNLEGVDSVSADLSTGNVKVPPLTWQLWKKL